VRRKQSRGFSLVEMTVALAIFGVLILVLAALEYELFRVDRAVQLDSFSHPEPAAVLARFRSDVLSCTGRPDSSGVWSQGPTTLLLTIQRNDGAETVIWDFSERKTAKRIVVRNSLVVSQWSAAGVPSYRIGTWMLDGGQQAVRLTGVDEKGGIVVDQIYAPRVTGA